MGDVLITYVVGDLLKSPARVLVNTVNTVGVMGKGIAKDFKTIYPEMFIQYQLLCERKQFHIGQLWLYKTRHKWILNFPTKKDWKQPSKIEYIEEGLRKFVSNLCGQRNYLHCFSYAWLWKRRIHLGPGGRDFFFISQILTMQ